MGLHEDAALSPDVLTLAVVEDQLHLKDLHGKYMLDVAL